ncbi:DsbA family protein [Tianweitania sediminis]|nr:DsbA family protein [Tianweitania sediminis]
MSKSGVTTMRNVVLSLAGGLAAVAVIGTGYLAALPSAAHSNEATAPAQATDGAEKARIEGIVRDYLLENPEILIEVQQALVARQESAQKEQQLAVLQQEGDAIFRSPHDGIIGNPDARTTVVEFFDYNCGYCKHALSDMQTMVQENPDLRFVLKEFPILGPDSQQAHVVSAALKKIAPEKYPEFHIRLLSGSGRAGEAAAVRVATDLGVEEFALREAMRDPTINDEFASTYELASKLAITGTPAYVVGDEIVFGAVGAEDLLEKLAAAKQ